MEHTEIMVESIEQDDGQKDKFLTFQVDKEEYAIDIRYVTQILGMQKITSLPDMPAFVKGIINLRGKVIPVIDVRTRFDKDEIEYQDRTCIIVIDINDVLVGLIVDLVNEVLNISSENIDEPPSVNKKTHRFIKGLGKVGTEVKIILDAQKLLFDEELELVAEAPVY